MSDNSKILNIPKDEGNATEYTCSVYTSNVQM